MTNNQFQYLQRQGMHGALLLVILSTINCAGVSNRQEAYIASLPIKPLFDSEEIAQLTTDEHAIVKYLATTLFEQKKTEAAARGRACTYFLKILGKNPAPTIIANLQDEKVSLKKASAGKLRGGVVYDPVVGCAELYSINRIDISDDTAKVEVSFYGAPLSAVGYEYRLVRKDNTWELVGSNLLWIS